MYTAILLLYIVILKRALKRETKAGTEFEIVQVQSVIRSCSHREIKTPVDIPSWSRTRNFVGKMFGFA